MDGMRKKKTKKKHTINEQYSWAQKRDPKLLFQHRCFENGSESEVVHNHASNASDADHMQITYHAPAHPIAYFNPRTRMVTRLLSHAWW